MSIQAINSGKFAPSAPPAYPVVGVSGIKTDEINQQAIKDIKNIAAKHIKIDGNLSYSYFGLFAGLALAPLLAGIILYGSSASAAVCFGVFCVIVSIAIKYSANVWKKEKNEDTFAAKFGLSLSKYKDMHEDMHLAFKESQIFEDLYTNMHENLRAYSIKKEPVTRN